MDFSRTSAYGRVFNDVLPVFNDHERDRLSIEDEETLKNFDLDWKKSRSRLPEMSYNFKRVERYKHVKVPDFIVKFWTLLVSTLIVLVLLGALVVNNIGKLKFLSTNLRRKFKIKTRILLKINCLMELFYMMK